MKINCATENFRELIWDQIVDAEEANNITLDAEVYDDFADEFAGDVLRSLAHCGVTWERCHTQSVGAMVCVQSATDEERDLFDSVVDSAMPSIAAKIEQFVESMASAASKVCGKTIEIDRSGGEGHCWRTVSAASDVPFDIIEEIEGHILDGGRATCADFVASDGQHYRW
jgi:hypothetical protein